MNQPKMAYAKEYENLYYAERDKVDVLAKRIAELEGMLSNDTAEWKSETFQKIKGLEQAVSDYKIGFESEMDFSLKVLTERDQLRAFCRQLIEALEQISENPFWDQCNKIAKKALSSDLAKRLKGEGK
jgi:hypothetical protein